MVSRRETIEVSVRDQILWVGAEAYPVHNIARAQTIALRPQNNRAVVRFLGYALLWIVLGLVAAVNANDSGFPVSVVPVIVGALILINSIGLLRALKTPTFYALVIETSGSPRAALITKDEGQLMMFVRAIMEAINNPKVNVGPFNIENFHLGDKHVDVRGGKVGIIGDHGQIGKIN